MNPNQSIPESWEDIANKGNDQPGDKPAGEKKVRKPLALKKDAAVFKPTEDSSSLMSEFFKAEIEETLRQNISGKMFGNALARTNPVIKEFKGKQPEKPVKKMAPSSVQNKEESKKDRNLKKFQGLASNVKTAKKEVIDLEAAIKDKTKYDDLVDEKRTPVNIVFIGHVDAGKSTICGNILLLSGKIEQNDIRKLQIEAKENNRESWYLAYIMDFNEEEKAKGKTVEVGKARFDTDNKRFTILDAPGHKNYVPNMIAGASQADVAALVISAKTGEFESGFDKGGQSKEHAMLAKSLGVTQLIVLINKMDDVNWDEKRFKSIRDQLEPFLKNSCDYEVDKIKWIPISGLHSDNMKEPSKNPKANWYTGPTLFEALDALELPKRDENGPIRIPIMDKFKESGTFVFGKVESGTIVPGLSLTIVPLGEQITITAIYNNDDRRVPYAQPGEGVKLQLKGIEDENISRGDVLCSNWSFTQVCQVMECELNLLDLPEHKPIMSSGYNCVMHLHSALEDIYIREILAEYDKDGKPKSTKFLRSNCKALVRIETLLNPICCEKYDFMPQLGRFTLRDEGKTIATGKILKVKPLWKDA